jgi:hypothetical protein
VSCAQRYEVYTAQMTSEKKIAANRLNAKRSTGPRTSWGKSRASGNAWRHGWAVAKTVPSAASADVERMAKAICGDHASPALYEQAVIIAESEMVLLKLRAARVAAIRRHGIVGPQLERRNPDSRFPAELMLAMEALVRGEVRPAIQLLNRQTRVLRAAVARVTNANAKIGAKGYDRADHEESSPPPPSCANPFLQRSDEDQPAMQMRDEVDAFQQALPELISLERYERRALSRRKRAIRMFQAIATFAAFSRKPVA